LKFKRTHGACCNPEDDAGRNARHAPTAAV
jgi:hypothetical protein